MELKIALISANVIMAGISLTVPVMRPLEIVATICGVHGRLREIGET